MTQTILAALLLPRAPWHPESRAIQNPNPTLTPKVLGCPFSPR